MGLDGVELIMAFEAGFGVNIPDRAAEHIGTPRDVVAYLERALPAGGSDVCLSQRAFYRLRDQCARHLGASPRRLHPSMMLDEVVDAHGRRGAWDAIGTGLGAERWPPPRGSGWLGRTFESNRPATVGDAARYAATWYPRAVKGTAEGWTRTEIERAVIALIEAEIGIDMRRHTLDSHFVHDMGID